jgi:hypothetical protein
MKYLGNYLLLFLILISFLSCKSQLVIIDQHRSDYRIILPADPSALEEKAASELKIYFEKMTGVALPVIFDTANAVRHEIIIGQSRRLAEHRVKTGLKPSDTDGFILLTRDEKLFITGNTAQGTLNGVYTFLEDYLGCRIYSPGNTDFPRMERITLDEIKDRQIPVFSYRELLFPGRYDPQYLAWHKLHSHHDGSWGMWVHTFDDLIPPKKYFQDHPEYFSEINGKRVADGQLCLSNPEVFDLLVRNLQGMMAKNPETLYWSVSQNDNFLACQCSDCKRIADEFGGESGLMIWFVNKVAALYPDKVISTLAYQYTRSAPKHIRPLPNVNIMLCTIECNRSMPIEDDPSSASFVKDIKDWTKLTDNILIWDYVVQFRNYISPFPNLHVLQPNLDFFARQGCRLMFQQGSNQALSEFVDLRSYVIAKLLWDPDKDADDIIKDFIYRYYGPAAPFIAEYIGMLHETLEISGDNLWIYGYPYSGIDSYLAPANLTVYKNLFDKAESAARDDSIILDRVIFARLPLDFAILDISLHKVDEELSWFSDDTGTFLVKDQMVSLLDTFTVRCNRLNVKTLNEQGLTPDEYRLMVKEFILKNSDRHLGIDKPVTLLTPFSPKYEAGGEKALTDGLRGIDDYHFNWLGFEGNDLEAVIDLGAETEIHEVSIDFLQFVQAWIFLPKSVTFSVSNDNVEYTKIGKAGNITPENKSGSFIQTFSMPVQNKRARYVKVSAEALKTCPDWHIGSGKNSWIFIDEIVIK